MKCMKLLMMAAIAATTILSYPPPHASAENFTDDFSEQPAASPANSPTTAQPATETHDTDHIAFNADANFEKYHLRRLTLTAGRAEPPPDTGLEKLSGEERFVASNFREASFKSDGKTLTVSLSGTGLPEGKLIASYTLRSDCANNSQFSPSEQVVRAIPMRNLKSALTDWTRYRHDAKSASLLTILERRPASETPDTMASALNYDVQLDLKSVTVSQR